MFISYKILVSLIIIRINAEDIVSDDNRHAHVSRKDKNTYNKVDRRFLDDLDDKQWHISHLKDTDFTSTNNCEETFEDKAKKYRKALQSDASLVEFVSADAIPVDEKDLVPNVCRVPDKKVLFKRKDQSNAKVDPKNVKEAKLKNEENDKSKTSAKKDLKTDTNVTETKNKDTKQNNTTEKIEEINVATTTQKSEKKDDDLKEEKHQGGRKASDYLFSSIEYYDDEPTFDETLCPDAVEVIRLELDQLRNYDAQCEQLLIWKSLEG